MTELVNRRQSVRITDRVLLAVNPVSPEKLQAIAEDFQQGISLYNQPGLADIQMFIAAQTALMKLRERDPDLADFLQHLDNKMNMLLQHQKAEKTPFDALELQKANISANGIAFFREKPAKLGETFEVHMVLLPAYVYVYCFGRVVSCEKAPEGGAEGGVRIALEYALLAEEDREKIVQHNFKQQSQALRNRRLNS